MKFRQLEYFLTVAEEGQITNAAAKLHMTQPPLSQQLRQLEESLGVKLMERTAKGIELTTAGRLLYSRGSQILALADTVGNELKDYARGALGTVNIGIISSAEDSLLRFDLPGFQRDNPRINYHIVENDTFSILDLLDRAIIEVAFVRTPFSSSGYHVVPLFSEPVVAVAGRSYVFHRPMTPPIELSQLMDERLVLLENYENTVMTACRQQGVEPLVVCRGNNAITALLCARAGVGVMITPRNTVNMVGAEDLVVLDIDCGALTSSLCMVWKEEREVSYATQKFIEHIQTLFGRGG